MADATEPPFRTYTRLVIETDVVGAMLEQRHELLSLFEPLGDQALNTLHPPYTWTLRQVLGHIIDTEHVFGYRALCFSRGDRQPLPGFDQEPYVAQGEFTNRSLPSLLRQWSGLRDAHLEMFRHMAEPAWSKRGPAAGVEWSVDDLARAIVGHARHHLTIVRKRLAIASPS
ncbi:MAG: DinB family protein [Tepidisphaeraceae bacterium]